jgi:hypothetical protein
VYLPKERKLDHRDEGSCSYLIGKRASLNGGVDIWGTIQNFRVEDLEVDGKPDVDPTSGISVSSQDCLCCMSAYSRSLVSSS